MTEKLIEASGRGAALTQHLLAFSRQQMLKPDILNLNRRDHKPRKASSARLG